MVDVSGLRNDEDAFLNDLNESQRAAVTYCDGPSLVIAGAGSGKTRVLTYKIAYLLRHGYKPWNILALTFTNKAANEMKARIDGLLGAGCARRLWMGTFHSVFLRILRAEHERIGFTSNFTIYDAQDSKNLLRAMVKELCLDDKQYRPAVVQCHVCNAKNQLVGAEEYVSNSENLMADRRSGIPELGKIFLRYAQRCRMANAMDFDDILLYTYLLFDRHPDVLQKYADLFQYILVDEYQDTNFAQHCIVRQLAHVHRRVCVVGDDAQSIYSFRGANIDNILSFNELYKEGKLFKLEQNYRSTQMIVEAANSVILKNGRQIHKRVVSKNECGERLRVYGAYSDIDEANIVVQHIRQLHRREAVPYSGFAVLYRTNAQSRVLEEVLRKSTIPYRVYGGLSFFQRKEVKDVVAYFRLVVNPDDEEAFKRVINFPKRGIGATTVQRVVDCAAVQNKSLWSVLSHPLECGLNLSRSTAEKMAVFREMIDEMHDRLAQVSAEEVGESIVRKSGLLAEINQDKTIEGQSRRENVMELLNGMHDFCTTRREEGNEAIGLTDYLSEISLLSDNGDADGEADEPKVALMTIHSAKGLEFNTVFVVGLEENLFPCQMAGSSVREMEEERRLFYVAVTRAEKHCVLTYARSRLRYGRMEFGNPSRFLSEVDSQYLDFGESMMQRRGAPAATTSKMSRLPMAQTASSRPVQASFSSSPQLAGTLRRIEMTPESIADIGEHPLHEGMRIEHERFGMGVVNAVKGSGDNARVVVAFEHAGTKQLLLKYTHFRIVE